VDRETYDRTFETLNAALNTSDVDRRERLAALRRLLNMAPFARAPASRR
jgi:hypothetical protein